MAPYVAQEDILVKKDGVAAFFRRAWDWVVAAGYAVWDWVVNTSRGIDAESALIQPFRAIPVIDDIVLGINHRTR